MKDVILNEDQVKFQFPYKSIKYVKTLIKKRISFFPGESDLSDYDSDEDPEEEDNEENVPDTDCEAD